MLTKRNNKKINAIRRNDKNIVGMYQNGKRTWGYDLVPYGGEYVTADSTFSGKTKDLKIQGQTYQNIYPSDNIPTVIQGGGVEGTDFTFESSNGYAKFEKIEGSEVVYSYLVFLFGLISNTIIKPNTTYTICGNFENINSISFRRPGGTDLVSDSVIFQSDGYQKILITTTNYTELTDHQLYLYMRYANDNTTFSVSDFQILEGDYTEIDIPTSITDIESVCEDLETLEVKTVGKNLARLDLSSSELFDSFSSTLSSGVIISTGTGSSYVWLRYLYNLSMYKPSTTYTLVLNIIENTLANDFFINADSTKRIFSDIVKIFVGETGIKKYTLTTYDDLSELEYILYGFLRNTETGSITYSFMILEGDYTEIDIAFDASYQTDQLTIPISHPLRSLPDGTRDSIEYGASPNIIDFSSCESVYADEGTRYIKAYSDGTFKLRGSEGDVEDIELDITDMLVKGQTYLVSCPGASSIAIFQIRLYYSTSAYRTKFTNYSFTWDTEYHTYTRAVAVIKIVTYGTLYDEIIYPMLTEGSTAPEYYEPYDPVMRLRDIQRVGEGVIESVTFGTTVSSGGLLFTNPIIPNIAPTSTNIICDKLPIVEDVETAWHTSFNCITRNNDFTGVRIYFGSQEELDALLPITVYYPLAIPIITEIPFTDSFDLDTYEKVTHVTSEGSNVEPMIACKIPSESVTYEEYKAAIYSLTELGVTPSKYHNINLAMLEELEVSLDA